VCVLLSVRKDNLLRFGDDRIHERRLHHRDWSRGDCEWRTHWSPIPVLHQASKR
jgi:hypothetical protein